MATLHIPTADLPAGSDVTSIAYFMAKIGAHAQIVSVADGTAAGVLLATKSPSVSNPLWVYRQDLDAIIRHNGTGWALVAGGQVMASCTITASVLTATVTAEVPTISSQTGGFSTGLTGNYSVLVPVDGLYTVYVMAQLSGTVPSGRAWVEVMVNDSTTASARMNMYGENYTSGSAPLQLSAGDGVKVQSYQTAGETRTISGTLVLRGEPNPLSL